MTWVAKKAFAKVAVQVALIWVGDCQMNGWQFLDWRNFFGIEDGRLVGRVALFRRQGRRWWLLRHCHRRLRRDRTLSSNSFSSSQIVYNLAPLSCQDPEYCYLFWRACLSLGHGQVDREHSLKVGLSVTFPKVQVANNGVNESKHKGNKKKSEFWD